jgi:serine/threonine-protein kinase
MAKGETVTVVVSTGAPQVEVPDVLEKSEDSARKKLEDAGFTVKVTAVESDATPGTVTEQDPEGGTKADKETEVTITVAKEALLDLPVLNRTYAEAEAQLRGIGFTNISRQDVDSDQPKDMVVGQSPEGPSKQAKDAQIVLKVSKGPAQPEQVTIPGDIVGKRYQDAKGTLEGLGLVVALAPNSSDKPNALVVQAAPGANTPVAKGSTVTLTTLGGTDGGGDGGFFGGRSSD